MYYLQSKRIEPNSIQVSPLPDDENKKGEKRFGRWEAGRISSQRKGCCWVGSCSSNWVGVIGTPSALLCCVTVLVGYSVCRAIGGCDRRAVIEREVEAAPQDAIPSSPSLDCLHPQLGAKLTRHLLGEQGLHRHLSCHLGVHVRGRARHRAHPCRPVHRDARRLRCRWHRRRRRCGIRSECYCRLCHRGCFPSCRHRHARTVKREARRS